MSRVIPKNPIYKKGWIGIPRLFNRGEETHLDFCWFEKKEVTHRAIIQEDAIIEDVY